MSNENEILQRMRELKLAASRELMHKHRQAEVTFIAEEEQRVQALVRHHAMITDSLIVKERALQAEHPAELEKVTKQLKKDLELDMVSLEHNARVMRKLLKDASERRMKLIEENGMRMATVDKAEYYFGLFRAVCAENHKLERGLLGEWYAV